MFVNLIGDACLSSKQPVAISFVWCVYFLFTAFTCVNSESCCELEKKTEIEKKCHECLLAEPPSSHHHTQNDSLCTNSLLWDKNALDKQVLYVKTQVIH